METGISYFGNRMPKHIAKDLVDIKKHNCTYVLHTCSEIDQAYYPGTMKEIVKISHDSGLKVQMNSWAVGGVFGGEAYSLFVMQNSNEVQELSNGKKLPAACLNSKKFRIFLKQFIGNCVSYGIDTFFWDEPHFYLPWHFGDAPGDYGCFCPKCKKLYREQYGKAMPKKQDRTVDEFREKCVASLLNEINPVLKRGRVEGAICVLPKLIEGENSGTGDWDRVASLKGIDLFATDPYWTMHLKRPGFNVEEFVRRNTVNALAAAKKYRKKAGVWVQCYSIKKGEEYNLETAVRTAFDCGARDIAAWGYGGASYMSQLACGRPEYCWDLLGELYKECRSKSKSL